MCVGADSAVAEAYARGTAVKVAVFLMVYGPLRAVGGVGVQKAGEVIDVEDEGSVCCGEEHDPETNRSVTIMM
jgi:hypothetical protein